MNRYTILCTEAQTKKALELGAPIEETPNDGLLHTPSTFIRTNVWYNNPTAEQMIGWLRSRGVKFLLSDEPDEDGDYWFVGINEEEQTSGADKENKELAAIDAALEYLTNNKK